MPAEPIKINAYIMHIGNGMHFAGIISLDNKDFPYRLELPTPIGEFDKTSNSNSGDLTSHLEKFYIEKIPTSATPLDDITMELFRRIVRSLAFDIYNDQIGTANLHADAVNANCMHRFVDQVPRTLQLKKLLDDYRQ